MGKRTGFFILKAGRQLTVGLGAFALLSAMGLYGPSIVQRIIGWLPGRMTTILLRDVLHRRGIHGLGYFDPAIDRLCFFLFIGLISLLVAAAVQRRANNEL
jgi:hypothetical protein